MIERRRIWKLLVKLGSQHRYPFPEARQALLVPNTQGVYLIRHPSGRVWHVGRTLRGRNGLHQRLTDHLRGTSSFSHACLGRDGSRLRRGFAFQYLEVASPRRRALLEFAATGWHCPKHIGLGARRGV